MNQYNKKDEWIASAGLLKCSEGLVVVDQKWFEENDIYCYAPDNNFTGTILVMNESNDGINKLFEFVNGRQHGRFIECNKNGTSVVLFEHDKPAIMGHDIDKNDNHSMWKY